MSLFKTMAITASSLTAQRVRMDVISNNVANMETTKTSEGGPYQRKLVKFRPIVADDFQATLAAARGKQLPTEGVEVVQVGIDQTPGRKVFDPNHLDADADGFVVMPNVDVLVEIADMMSASRSYEAGVTVFNSAKSMFISSLEIGRG